MKVELRMGGAFLSRIKGPNVEMGVVRFVSRTGFLRRIVCERLIYRFSAPEIRGSHVPDLPTVLCLCRDLLRRLGRP